MGSPIGGPTPPFPQVTPQEKQRERMRLWRAANKERIKQYMQSYRAEHKGEISAKTEQWRETHREQYQAKKQESDKARYLRNRERILTAERLRRASRTRICRFCQKEKSISEFPAPQSFYCRECEPANQAHRRATQKQWHEEHHEEMIAYGREHYAANRDRHAEYRKRYYEEHKAEFINRANQRQRSLQGSFTQEDVDRLYRVQNGRCAGCRKPLRDNYEIDHVMPICKGGSNTSDNLQLLCLPCNRRKHSKLPDQWAQEIGKLFI